MINLFGLGRDSACVGDRPCGVRAMVVLSPGCNAPLPGNGGTSVGGGAGRVAEGVVDEVRAVVLEMDGSFTVVGESSVDRITGSPGDR